jgi:hypothetical protein
MVSALAVQIGRSIVLAGLIVVRCILYNGSGVGAWRARFDEAARGHVYRCGNFGACGRSGLLLRLSIRLH